MRDSGKLYHIHSLRVLTPVSDYRVLNERLSLVSEQLHQVEQHTRRIERWVRTLQQERGQGSIPNTGEILFQIVQGNERK